MPTTAPILASRDWLTTAGRALMRWWNDQGATLPGPGEAYRAWWRRTYLELEGDVWGPSDVAEQLDFYADEARRWWEGNGRVGDPPPAWQARNPADFASEISSNVKWIVLGGVALLFFLRRR